MGTTKLELAELIVEVWNPMCEQIAYAKGFVLPPPDAAGNRDLRGRPFTMLWSWLVRYPPALVRQGMETELRESRPDIRRVPDHCRAISPGPPEAREGPGPVRWMGDRSGVCMLNLLRDSSPFAVHVKRWPHEAGTDWEGWYEQAIELLRLGRTTATRDAEGEWVEWPRLMPRYQARLDEYRAAKQKPSWRARLLFTARLAVCFARDKAGAAAEIAAQTGLPANELYLYVPAVAAAGLLPDADEKPLPEPGARELGADYGEPGEPNWDEEEGGAA